MTAAFRGKSFINSSAFNVIRASEDSLDWSLSSWLLWVMSSFYLVAAYTLLHHFVDELRWSEQLHLLYPIFHITLKRQ